MKVSRKCKTLWKAMKMELREHRSSFIVFVILRALVILMMILQLFNHNYENVFLCVLTLLLLMVPSFVQINLKIELPKGRRPPTTSPRPKPRLPADSRSS